MAKDGLWGKFSQGTMICVVSHVAIAAGMADRKVLLKYLRMGILAVIMIMFPTTIIKSAADQPADNQIPSLVNPLAESVFHLAWPLATFESWQLQNEAISGNQIDITVRLFGIAAENYDGTDGTIWTDVILKFGPDGFHLEWGSFGPPDVVFAPGQESQLAANAINGALKWYQNQEIAQGQSQPSSVENAPTNGSSGTTSEGSILWVDDHPENDTGLTNAFQRQGIDVVQANSTEDALNLILREQPPFIAIITNMGRGGDENAGLELVHSLHAAGIAIPVIIYSSFWSSSHLGQEQSYGVQMIAADGAAVYQTVIQDASSVQH